MSHLSSCPPPAPLHPLKTAVRTGTDGMKGISLLLLEKEMPGIKIRKMKTQFDTCHNTSFITLDDVKVPVENRIGAENAGFMYDVEMNRITEQKNRTNRRTGDRRTEQRTRTDENGWIGE